MLAAPALALCAVAASAQIRLDGEIDEPGWAAAQVFDAPSLQVYPKTLEVSPRKVTVRVLAGKDALYVAYALERPPEEARDVRQRRDQLRQGDIAQVWVDASGKEASAYIFGVSPTGDIVDAFHASPTGDIDTSWDAEWESAAARGAAGWSVEMRIPWTAMDMGAAPAGQRRIGLLFAHRRGATNTWYNKSGFLFRDPAFLPNFHKMELGEVQTRGASFWVAASLGDRDPPADPRHRVQKLGLEGRWRIGAGQTLEFTLAPDFSDAEADQVELNFSPFETRFAEKRAFFKEGQDAFQVGVNSASMVHTRRIGETADFSCGAYAGDAAQKAACEAEDDRNAPAALLGAVKYRRQGGASDLALLAAAEEDADYTRGRSFLAARWRGTLGGHTLGWVATAVDNPVLGGAGTGLGLDLRARLGASSELQALVLAADPAAGGGVKTGASLRWQAEATPDVSVSAWLEAYQDGLDLSDLGFLRRDDLLGYGGRAELRMPGGDGGRVRQRQLRLSAKLERNARGEALVSRYTAEYATILRSGADWRLELGYRPPGVDDRITDSSLVPKVGTPEYFWGSFRFATASGRPLRFSGELFRFMQGLARVEWGAGARARLEWTTGELGSFWLGAGWGLSPRWNAKRDAVLSDEQGVEVSNAERVLLVEYRRVRTSLQAGWSYAHPGFGEIALALDGSVAVGTRGESLRATPDERLAAEGGNLPPDFRRSGLTVQVRYELPIGRDSKFGVAYRRSGDRTQDSRDGTLERDFLGGLGHAWDEAGANDLVASLRMRF